jgi:uncharacterized protein with NRDE domain
MCVIFFAYNVHPKYPLIVLANRDEFYDRPTSAAARWDDHPQIFAGRDLIAGGTWLGVTDHGRFAAVTNYREPGATPGEISRGKLVTDFLLSRDRPFEHLSKVRDDAARYYGFNLIAGEFSREKNAICYFSNRTNVVEQLQPGVYGLSNHLLNTAWPKVSSGIRRFTELVSKQDISHAECFELLADQTLAADEELPNTGLGIERERMLSPIFIKSPHYGTRSSTLVFFDGSLDFRFKEKIFA